MEQKEYHSSLGLSVSETGVLGQELRRQHLHGKAHYRRHEYNKGK